MRRTTSAARHRGAIVVAAAFAALALTSVAACENLPGNEAIVCSSDTKNVGAGCVATYDLCKGGTYKLECTPGGPSVQCTCIESNVVKTTFPSSDACKVTPDTLRKRASAGCSWQLD